MNIDFKKFKEHCVEYCIFDSYQYAEGMIENIHTANYCLEMINRLIYHRNSTHLQFQEKISQSLHEQLESKNVATIGVATGDLPNDKLEMLGLPTSCTWLLEKYIKDYFQYIRNSYDAIAQVINFALIAGDNNSNNEVVDFAKVKKNISSKYKSIFPLTEDLLVQTINSDEYLYICDYNNRTKHIKSVKTKIANELFGDGSTYKLLGFEKNSIHSDEDIQSIIRTIYDFTDKFIDDVFKAVTIESKQRKYTSHRIHDLQFYSQSKYNNPNSSFTNIFIKVEAALSELPNEIEVLAIRTGTDTIAVSNINVDALLVCTDEGKNPSGCVGRFNAKKPLKSDGLYHYRRYIKDLSDTDNNVNYYFSMMKGNYYHVSSNAICGTAVFINYPKIDTEADEKIIKMLEKYKQMSTSSEDTIMTINFEKTDDELTTE